MLNLLRGVQGGGWRITAAFAALVLSAAMLPGVWPGNEVNYFDLSQHFLDPDRYGPDFAATDSSQARFLSFAMIGAMVDAFGFETARVVLRLLMLGVFGASYAFMADRLGFSRMQALVALVAFLLLKQAQLGGEWIFGGIEAKSFAYAAVFVAIACAWSGRSRTAMVLAALATYFHFLVGGFWAVALVALMVFRAGRIGAGVVPALLFGVLVLPLATLILFEQLGSSGGLADGLTAEQIYAQLRNPHHVAPFVSSQLFLARWLPGIAKLAASLALIGACAWRTRDRLAVFVLGLNLYLVAALLVSAVDREAARLGAFYLFRPSALILLLTLLLLLRWAANLQGGWRRGFAVAEIVLLVVGVARVPYAAYKWAAKPTLERALSPEMRELVVWLRENTPADAVVVAGPWPANYRPETRSPWVGFERLIERPTLVNYKFVPTRKDEIIRWYNLLAWRRDVFAGNCHRLAEQPVDYLAVREAEVLSTVAACGETLWSNGTYAVVRVASGR